MARVGSLSSVLVVALAAASCRGPARPPANGASTAAAPAPALTLVLAHGHVFDAPGADAVAIAGERIAEVGASAALVRACAPPCRVVDVRGGFLVPGFHDAHAHPFSAGRRAEELHVRTASVPAVQAAVKAYAAAHPQDPWILGEGWYSGFVTSWPTAADLDLAEARRPVVLVDASGHDLWVNSAALAAAGIGAATPDPPGGRIVHPLGVLLDAAGLRVLRSEPPVDDDAIARAIGRGLGELLAVGVTSTAEGGTETLHVAETYARLDREGKLAQRVFLWAPLAVGEDLFARWLAFARSLPAAGKVHVAAFKGFADGTMGSRTAALLAPYADAPSTSGELYERDADLDALVVRANRAGFPVAIHAIGDRAVRQALDAFERSKATLHHRLVNRVEHAAVVDPADRARFGRLGVAASVQPVWQAACPSRAAFLYAKRLGAEREPETYAWRSLAEGGARLLFGSDMPSSPAFDPLEGVWAATTRRFADGETFLPGEALDADAALRAYTSAAPAAMGWGDRLGTLERGKLADVVWLDHDPRAGGGARSVKDDPIRAIVIGGQIVAR